MATQPTTFITPEEYLLRERAAASKSEYHRGKMYARAGTSRAHSLIVSNLMIQIGSRLRTRDCEIHSSDMRLLVSETGLYTYPDVMVICGQPVLADHHFDIVTNPVLIIEVLSPSTEDYDRGRKLHQYMRIPSLHEYLTVSQSERLVDQSVRQTNGGWLVNEITPKAGNLTLASLNLELSFSDIYQKVEFSTEALNP